MSDECRNARRRHGHDGFRVNEMKILTAMYTLRRGGAYDRFLMMLEAFLERDCEIHCLSVSPILIENSLFHNHVMYFPFKTTDGFIARLLVFFAFPVWSVWVAWRNRIDILVAFGSLYAFIEVLSKRFLKRPMVTFIRGNSSFGLEIRNAFRYAVYLNKIIENIGLNSCDRIITNNTGVKDEISEHFGGREIDVQVLTNNIPQMNTREPINIVQTRNKYGIPGNGKVLVTAGILNRGKNIETLIKCFPKIGLNNLYCVIVGDGLRKADFRYRDFLKILAKQLGVDKHVLFTGWLEKEDLWKIYLASDLFVSPSLSEGMPNALLEALGLNLACMGSWIPGIKDILQYEELMFDPEDEEAIARKASRFFSDEQHANHIRQLCCERRKDFLFDWEERAFQMVTQRPFHKGKACRSM